MCVDGSDMPFLGRLVLEPGRTERAAIWSLSRVGPSMSDELLSPNEPGRAHPAPVVLHTIVDLHMFGVVRHVVKPGTALLTLADHFACVDQFVSRQAATTC